MYGFRSRAERNEVERSVSAEILNFLNNPPFVNFYIPLEVLLAAKQMLLMRFFMRSGEYVQKRFPVRVMIWLIYPKKIILSIK